MFAKLTRMTWRMLYFITTDRWTMVKDVDGSGAGMTKTMMPEVDGDGGLVCGVEGAAGMV